MGYVYLIEMDRFHKIGASKDPAKRLRAYSNLPHKARLVHTFPSQDPYGVEGALHTRFAARHVRGEWFRLAGEDVEAIRRVQACDGPLDLPEELRPERQSAGWKLVRIPAEVHQALKILADGHGSTISAELDRIIVEELERHGLWPPPPAAG